MLLILSLLGIALGLLVCAPLVLTVGHWQVRFPRAALTLWFAAFFAGCAAAAASVIAAVLAAIGAVDAVSAGEGLAATVVAWLGLGAVGAVITLVAAAAGSVSESKRGELAALTPLVTSCEQRDGFVLSRFTAAEPIACAVSSPEPTILLSSGMQALLPPAQLQAVLAHEFAHVRGRHEWAVRLAEINSACLPPRLPAGRVLRRVTRLLVELIADDAAARQAGAVNLANALLRLAAHTGDQALVLRADRLTLRPWRAADRCRVPDAIRI